MLTDAVASAGFIALVFVVHDVPYLLGRPFWVDEAWVADSTRVPLNRVPAMASTSPLGWTILLHVVVFGGVQRYRLVPLAFAALAATAAYYLGKEVRGVLAGMLCGIAVALLPAMLLRDDLKQYTAEAFVAIAGLVLLARLETRWSRPRLAALAGFLGMAMLVANAAVFVAAAVLSSLLLVSVVRRRWNRVAELTWAGAAVLLWAVVIYYAVDRPHRTPTLSRFWRPYYLPTDHGLGGAVHFIRVQGDPLIGDLGVRQWAVVGLLVALGLLTVVKARRYELAIVLPVMLVLAAVASAVHLYPLLDARTSTYWIVCVSAMMALGVSHVVMAISTKSRTAALAVTWAVLASYVILVRPDIRAHTIPNEDVRSQVAYVEKHRQPNDTVIVDYYATWGFAYYDHDTPRRYVRDSRAAPGFVVTYPSSPWLITMTQLHRNDIAGAVADALRRLVAHPGGRIWLVETHVTSRTESPWTTAFADFTMRPIDVGPEPLWLVQPRTNLEHRS
jgi:hypothetical protein